MDKLQAKVQRWRLEGREPGAPSSEQVWDVIQNLRTEVYSLLQIRLNSTHTLRSRHPVKDVKEVLPADAVLPVDWNSYFELGMSDGASSPSRDNSTFELDKSSGASSPSRHSYPFDLDKPSSSYQSQTLSPSRADETQKVVTSEPHSFTNLARYLPIDSIKDDVLIQVWHQRVLPIIKSQLCGNGDSSISITLLRQGTIDTSEPIVRVQTAKPRSSLEQSDIVHALSREFLPEPSPRVVFVTGSVRRTARRSDLDSAPCTAQNTAFIKRPPMGVSIGVDGSVTDTATLGGYIYLDNVPHILTVHHLFMIEETGLEYDIGTIITQPSLQEVKEFEDIWDRLKSYGNPFHMTCVQSMFENLKACLPSFPFARLTHSSGFRNRPSRGGMSNVEMDWAICKVDGRRVGSNITPCKSHFCQDTTPVNPGGLIFSVGRTSGLQDGVINGCTASLFLQNDDGSYRESEEWFILPSSTTSEELWATNGIGISGDSGAWILEEGTDRLIGQLWGRDFEAGTGDSDGNIITYFTPIHDIFDDILSFTGASTISMTMTPSNGDDNEGERSRDVNNTATTQVQSPDQAATVSQSIAGIGGIFALNFDNTTSSCQQCSNTNTNCECITECLLNIIMESNSTKDMCGICQKTMNLVVRTKSIEKAEEDYMSLAQQIESLKMEMYRRQGSYF